MVNPHRLLTPESYITGSPPERVTVEGVSRGLVVAVYNPREKTGMVGYFVDPRKSSEFERMHRTVKADWNGNGLEVILASVARWQEDDVNARLYPLLAFEAAGVPTVQIKEKSLKSGNVADITFNMRTGKLQIRRSQIPEPDDPHWLELMQKQH